MTRTIITLQHKETLLETGFRALTPTERICRTPAQLPQYPALALIAEQLSHGFIIAGGVHAYCSRTQRLHSHSVWRAAQWGHLRLVVPPRQQLWHRCHRPGSHVPRQWAEASLSTPDFCSFALGRGKVKTHEPRSQIPTRRCRSDSRF